MNNTVKVTFGKRQIAVSELQDRNLTKTVNTFEMDHTGMTDLAKRHLKCQVKITTWTRNRVDDKNVPIERVVVNKDIMLDKKIFGLRGEIGWKFVTQTLITMVKVHLEGWHSSMEKRMIVKVWPPGLVPNDTSTGQVHIYINLTDMEVLEEKIR